MSARMPSSSSSASRKTWLSSTRRILIGRPMAVRTLLGRQKQGVVRLAALLHVHRDRRMRVRDPAEQRLERLVLLADEQRQQLLLAVEELVDDRVCDLVEVAASGDGLSG